MVFSLSLGEKKKQGPAKNVYEELASYGPLHLIQCQNILTDFNRNELVRSVGSEGKKISTPII